MHKKFLAGVAPLVAMAAFAVMPSMASASELGSCTSKVTPATVPPCPTGYKFTALVGPVPEVVSKSAETGVFLLKNKAGTAGFSCEKQSGQGVAENKGGTAYGELVLVYEKCKGIGAFGVGGPYECGKVNETEKISGVISTENLAGGKEKVNIVTGFNVACPHIKTDLGSVTGAVEGTEVSGKGYETAFASAEGLLFAGEETNITGTSTDVTFAKVKLYSH